MLYFFHHARPESTNTCVSENRHFQVYAFRLECNKTLEIHADSGLITQYEHVW